MTPRLLLDTHVSWSDGSATAGSFPEISTLDLLRDPAADKAIVATARIHRLTLLTSNQRIIDSNVVPVIA